MSRKAKLAFLFDLGNVLVDCNLDRAIEEIVRHSTVSAQEIGAMVADELLVEFDRGTLSGSELTQAVRELRGYTGDEQSLQRIWQQMLSPNQAMIDLFLSLRKRGYSAYILSNINPFHTDYVLRTFPFLEQASGRIFSCECNLVKPQPEIFAHAAEVLRLEPSRTLFIDDREENILAAKAAGFRVLHHKDAASTIRIIGELTV